MEKIEITSMSSRGQMVIPHGLREKLNINIGEKFIALGEGDTIILKKIDMPSFEGIEKLLEKTREFVKNKGIRESDVRGAIKDSRKK